MTSDVTVVPIECVKDDVLMLMLMIGNHSDDKLLLLKFKKTLQNLKFKLLVLVVRARRPDDEQIKKKLRSHLSAFLLDFSRRDEGFHRYLLV